MAEPHNPLLEVQENLRIILSQVVSGVHQTVNEYLRQLRTYYFEYLKVHNNLSGNSPDLNLNLSDQTFNRIDYEYRNLEKTLKKIAKHISGEFEYAAETGKDVIFYYQKCVSIMHDIDNAQQLSESLEKNKKLSKLYKKYRKTVDKYNKSANEFNTCVLEFQTIVSNLERGLIVISSKTSDKSYSISYEQLQDWWNRLGDNDEISKLRNQLKQKLAANRPPIVPLDTTSLNLTPIAIMSIPQARMSASTQP
ncbi:uncharacterized LOC118071988 [Chelonus insularis]|uniref:uncharacterized LOC118071988 n=1 Tax=Chelonus insularis TaxID=460826 RepID=UPI001588A773|nr:uncharacterized LOC118071988 [Chelonus insularis]KAG8148309.1 BVpp28d_like protein [Chelonus insularis]